MVQRDGSRLGKDESFNSSEIDVFKTLDWRDSTTAEDEFEDTNRYRKESNLPPLPWSNWNVAPPTHPERWTRTPNRDLYFSVRLEQLFKRAKIKGQLVRLAYFNGVKTSPDDEAWIGEKLRLLAEHGLAETPKAVMSSTSQKWFEQFLKRNTRNGIKKVDLAMIEKKHKLTLPQDYKNFISTIGPKSFENIIETEGFTAHVLPPAKVDFKNFRRGRVPGLDEEQSQIDGVMFASTDHGDAFVFDVSGKGKDYPIFWHDHEQNTLEPFAPNFADCIKRFSQKN